MHDGYILQYSILMYIRYNILYCTVNGNLPLIFHQVALWTLGQQVASTGYVVEPYRKYPSLLEVLLNFLKTEQNQGIRREVGTRASNLTTKASVSHSCLDNK